MFVSVVERQRVILEDGYITVADLGGVKGGCKCTPPLAASNVFLRI